MEKLTIAEVAEFAGMKQAQAKHQMKLFLCEKVLKSNRTYSQEEVRGMFEFSGINFEERVEYAKGIHKSQKRVEHVYSHKASIKNQDWSGGMGVYKKWGLLPKEVIKRIENSWKEKHQFIYGSRQVSLLDFENV